MIGIPPDLEIPAGTGKAVGESRHQAFHRHARGHNLSDISMLDYFNVVNAILRNGPDPIGATADVDLHWFGTDNRLKVSNEIDGGARH